MALRCSISASLLHQLRSALTASATAGVRSLSDAAHAAPGSGRLPADGLTLQDFIRQHGRSPDAAPLQPPPGTALAAASAASARTAPPLYAPSPAALPDAASPPRTAFVETYGCQMNVNDSEVVLAVLDQAGFQAAASPEAASVIFLNTCAIRENAEAKVGSG